MVSSNKFLILIVNGLKLLWLSMISLATLLLFGEFFLIVNNSKLKKTKKSCTQNLKILLYI
jgi:hypothetical protein